MASIDEHKFSKKVSELKAAFRVQRYCVHTLCEHDEVGYLPFLLYLKSTN